MIELVTDFNGFRKMDNGNDGPSHGSEMLDQYIAILMGWGIAIDDTL
jgi:hypothetical protein